MTNETLRYAATMLAAGVGVPMLAALNAQLGVRLGSPAAAATMLFSVALVASLLVLAVTAGLAPLASIPGQPPHLFLGGLLVAFYVLSVTWIAPRFGVGNAIFCVLLGQMVSASVIDHFGLMGAQPRPVDMVRLCGLALMAGGLALTQRT